MVPYFMLIYSVIIISLIAIIYLVRYTFSQDKGTSQMQEISTYIKEGAMAFIKRQYKTIFVLSIVALFLIILSNYFGNASKGPSSAISISLHTGIAFITGAFCSALSGYIGMYMAVNSNVRAAAGAKKGLNNALQIALKGGAVTGLAVTSLSLLGVASLFLIYGGISGNDTLIKEAPSLIVGFGFGASFVALFAQLGGGIYTKAADVGADLVGKVEAGIPEDDPRNPAVIADLVGDNVGDCAGRGADLFESTAAENIGAMILGVGLYPIFGWKGILFPLVARALGIIASIIGIFAVKVKNDNDDPMKALKGGFVITSIINLVILFFVVKDMLSGSLTTGGQVNYIYLYGCAVAGILLSYVFVVLTDYYTSITHKPVKEIATASKTGAGTNIITGLSVGMESTALPVVCISICIFISYRLSEMALPNVANAGLYGTAIATMGMLSTCTYILAMDTFGPITDNAGGITEMSGAPEEIRNVTDRLDACGNTTKALTKGYAVGSAALATFLLFSAYLDEVKKLLGKPLDSWFSVDIGKPEVFIGGFIGAMIVFLFSSTAIRAVGKAAQYVILEVRQQFKEIPGIMEGKSKPDYARCVDIVTKGALKEMVLPGIIVISAPIIVGILLGKEAAAGFLMITTISGVIMALFLNNGGGAWDNAKKLIELGEHGGKNSEAHRASVVGDTVGDPFKDTAGPSLHVLIKLVSTLTLVFVALFA
ncbi:sodium-translocating pyrophosphatase [Clostridium beijerinckii]|uniref:K(+)-insensitive pyrophosphate-energized proton pump n=1 Tax=Clostridium beijerinckii TaxID=1520 RepID=A0A1S8S520_CLOBE|nr:sodium-translocating pyrophosphatase [Clostridium beijerinckii]NOW06817.1 K(+)-stimulated pyrophosphate-energized sodium pump [Clostridium beijerinckii]NRT74508.1 K(+)-stimulated pyrophosphate-energized sodium pump [Clostridium beijerinckii]NRY60911.1 K(+)-stimulated pyrophosphate-energized sodium pump [Clostridium beijerinckii]NYC05410.1 K(+)-stimulated pyrophosphate-energized sodium pump [Clostridium beijerinckii]OOM60452.1 K(+)-stimulated pyrophosphate-energized sodium pump [Clostridium 